MSVTTGELAAVARGCGRSGARRFAVDPAWDTDFAVADMLILLPMSRLNGRYTSHYRRGTSGWPPPQADSISY